MLSHTFMRQQISSSRQYKDKKIEEFRLRVEELEKEHKRFVAKVQALDPSYKDIVPWEPRGYSRKRSRHYRPPESAPKLCEHHVVSGSQADGSHDCHVRSLDGVRDGQGMEVITTVCREGYKSREPTCGQDRSQGTLDVKIAKPPLKDLSTREKEVKEPVAKGLNNLLLENMVASQDLKHVRNTESKCNALHLDYSSSSSESSDEGATKRDH